MKILDTIKKNWDFNKSVESNTISFNTKAKADKKAFKQMLLFSFIIVAIGMVFNVPIFLFGLMICAITYGSKALFDATEVVYISAAKIDSTHFVVAYYAFTGTHSVAVIGSISGTTITYGTVYEFFSGQVVETDVCVLDSTHIAIAYKDNVDDQGKAIIGVITSTDVITFGSKYVYNSANTRYSRITALDSTHFAVAYFDTGGDGDLHSKIGVVSAGDEIAFGSEYTVSTTPLAVASAVCMLDSTHIVVSFRDSSDSNSGQVKIGVISSGDVITYGSQYEFSATAVYHPVVAIDSTHFIVAYRDAGNSNYVTAIIGTVASGDEVSYGTAVSTDLATTDLIDVSLLDSTHFVISFEAINKGYSIIGTISDTDTIVFGTASQFNDKVGYTNVEALDATNFVNVYRNESDFGKGTAIVGVYSDVVGPANLKSYNGLALASIKSINGVAIADIKSINGLE